MIGKIHLFGGLLILGCFLVSGQYLDQMFSALELGSDPVRYMYRANHTYILLSGLLNIAIGIRFELHKLDWKRGLQYLGSLHLCVAPAVLIYAFIVEAQPGEGDRFFTGLGVFFLFLGTLLQIPSSPVFTRKKRI